MNTSTNIRAAFYGDYLYRQFILSPACEVDELFSPVWSKASIKHQAEIQNPVLGTAGVLRLYF